MSAAVQQAEAARPSPMVVAAAREMCRQQADECGIDKDDLWKLYGEEFLACAELMLKTAGVPALLEALAEVVSSDLEMSERGKSALIARCRALIAEAGGAGKGTPPRFQWCCEKGCGPCDVKRIEYEYSRTEDSAGNLLESKTIPRLVSKCCGAGLSMWDNEKDEQIDVATEPMLLPFTGSAS
jgi:hypothetical protein